MHDCLFCKIVNGEIPSLKIYDDNDVYAFLDINPANLGHTLVIPKKHSTSIFDTNEKDLEKLIIVVKKLAEKIKEKTGADGINILQNNGQHAGQLVHHIHFHIIPRFANDSVMIRYPRANINEQQIKEIWEKLRNEQPAPSYTDMNWDV